VTSQECYDLVRSTPPGTATVLLKHETMIMHIICKTVGDARRLHAAAIASSFRESGIVLGKKGPIVQVRTTSSLMEVPLMLHGEYVLDCLKD